MESIRKLMRGENTLHPQATSQLMKVREPHVEPPHKLYPLTPREQDVLSELTKGKSNKEIASSLFVKRKQ